MPSISLKYILTVKIFLTVTVLKLYAQESINYNTIVNYDIIYNTEIPNTKKGSLFYNQSNKDAVFIYGSNKDKKVLDGANDTSLILQYAGSERFNYHGDRSIYSKENSRGSSYLVQEPYPKMEWQLLDEQKMIDAYKVQKATLSFRGRQYVAWYCIDFPISVGPWKFNGLPGLIMEIYDTTQRYHWLMTSIEVSEKPATIDFLDHQDNLEKLSLKEFVKIRYSKNSNLLNSTRLPRGSTVTVRDIPRNGIELVFEWEVAAED